MSLPDWGPGVLSRHKALTAEAVALGIRRHESFMVASATAWCEVFRRRDPSDRPDFQPNSKARAEAALAQMESILSKHRPPRKAKSRKLSLETSQ